MNARIMLLITGLGMASCVPQRKFQDLQKNYEESQRKTADCNKDKLALQDRLDSSLKAIKDNKADLDQLNRDTTIMGASNRKLNMLYGQINTAYQTLLDKVKELESQNKLRTDELSAGNLELQKKLNEKEMELNNKETDLKKQASDLMTVQQELDKTKKDLKEREDRVNELSQVLNQKDSAVNALRNSINNALLNFKDKGLTVSVKNGKVYVSVEEKLLFESGKYSVNATGKSALMELAKVLNSDTSIHVMVEGHTDNKPYLSSNGVIKDNLDLSVMRATEVSRILIKDGKLNPKRVTAAGRGDTQPIATNDTPEGRAKNRRTEIILTPKLTELFKVLGQD